MCLGAIYWARPDHVYYASTQKDASAFGFDDSFIYEELRLPHGARKIPMLQMICENALAPLLEWRKKPDKTEY
jgi:tRNA(Arg) A34 adenosine deaminase TadA